MTTSQFLKIRGALLSAGILADTSLDRALNAHQSRFYKSIAEKIDTGLRTLDSIEAERSDLPELQQMAIALAAELSSDSSSSSQEVA